MEQLIKQKKSELDREKNKLTCKKYYLENKIRLLERGCEKVKCEKCNKMVSRNFMGKHLQTKLCKRREQIVNLIKEMDSKQN